MLYLYLEAPFAAFRTFTAGWYRPTATFLTPSAAYGLLLNVAGIESRLREGEDGHNGRTPTSYGRRGLPACRLALGLPGNCFPRLQSVYQQLHNYPVGKGNRVEDPDRPGETVYQGELAARRTAGNKPNITPVRREFLSDLRAVIALDGPAGLEEGIRRGLRGEGGAGRYGVPFLGDNAFLLDRLMELVRPSDRFPTVRWYERLGAETTKARSRATRLTILIDRADLSRTESALFAPTDEELPADDLPPPAAWVEISPPPAQPEEPAARRQERPPKQ
jgi:CRISPR-associated protein Cas5t